MEEEIFDEARRCPNCDVVTYCDTCPICGKKLPRSAHVTWRLFHGIGVAGEDEVMLQPTNFEHHRGHIKERVVKSTRSLKRTNIDQDDHVKPDLSISSHERADSVFDEIKPKKNDASLRVIRIASIIAVVSIILLIVSVVILSDESIRSKLSGEEQSIHVVDHLTEVEEIPDNHGDLQLYDYSYDPESYENVISMINRGERGFVGDLVLLDENEQEIGTFEHLYVYPYEDFDLTMYTNDPGTSYKFENSKFYEINSTKPDYALKTYENYGTVEVNIDSVIDFDGLEILVNYLYEASVHNPQGVMYGCDIYMSDDSSYSVYISEQVVSAYLFDKNHEYTDTHEFKFTGSFS